MDHYFVVHLKDWNFFIQHDNKMIRIMMLHSLIDVGWIFMDKSEREHENNSQHQSNKVA